MSASLPANSTRFAGRSFGPKAARPSFRLGSPLGSRGIGRTIETHQFFGLGTAAAGQLATAHRFGSYLAMCISSRQTLTGEQPVLHSSDSLQRKFRQGLVATGGAAFFLFLMIACQSALAQIDVPPPPGPPVTADSAAATQPD